MLFTGYYYVNFISNLWVKIVSKSIVFQCVVLNLYIHMLLFYYVEDTHKKIKML